MNCGEAQLKAQAIIDNELDENEIDSVISHMETCYSCRKEYIDLLKLQRRIGHATFPEPSKEWFEKLARSKFRRGGTIAGRILFIGSYLFLFLFFLVQYFSRSSEDSAVKIGFAGILIGALVLFMVTLCDRMRELKTDRYKEIQK